MRKLLLLITFLISSFGFAQFKTFDKIDEYKNERNIQFQASIYKNWMVSDGITKNFMKKNIYLMTHIKEDTKTGDISTFLTLDLRNKENICSSPGNEVFITLENNQVIKLIQSSEIQCGKSIHVSYPVTEDQLKIMSIYDFKNIRVYMNDIYTDREIKDKLKPIIKGTIAKTISQIEELEDPTIEKTPKKSRKKKNKTTKKIETIKKY